MAASKQASKQANKQANIHMHMHSAVPLVWGSLKLAPINVCKCHQPLPPKQYSLHYSLKCHSQAFHNHYRPGNDTTLSVYVLLLTSRTPMAGLTLA